MVTPASARPVRLVILAPELTRSRLTVLFRALLVLPHIIWLLLWTVAVLPVLVVDWFATLILGHSPAWAHRFLSAYLRCQTHVYAYLYLACDRFPGFLGRAGYPVDVEIAAPAGQTRVRTAFRLVLAIPAVLVASAVGGGSLSASFGSFTVVFGVSLLTGAAFCGWWVGLIQGRMPAGLEHAAVYGLNYATQLTGYMLLLTERYPSADPTLVPAPAAAPEHPVGLRVAGSDDPRDRLTVAFRLILVIPHLLWAYGWGLVANLFAFAQWWVILFTGRPDKDIHGLIASYLRFQAVLAGYVTLLSDPYPPFVPDPQVTYPIDLDPILPEPSQSRAGTFFRLVLALPALLIGSAYSLALGTVAFLSWWAILFTGRMPEGLRRLGLAALRFTLHLHAYLLLLTERYPYSGPTLDGTELPRRPTALLGPSVPAPTASGDDPRTSES